MAVQGASVMLRLQCMLLGALPGFLPMVQLLYHAAGPRNALVIRRNVLPPGLFVAAQVWDIGSCGMAVLAAQLAAPILGAAAPFYTGAGLLCGQCAARLNQPPAHGATLCAWLVLAMPVTGILCCLAGGAAALGTGCTALGVLCLPVLGALFALLQFGPECALLLLGATSLTLWRYHRQLTEQISSMTLARPDAVKEGAPCARTDKTD